MQTNREKLDYLVWSAKDKINKLFDVRAPIEETHAAIQELRGFLEARAAQTATPFVPPGSEVPYSPKAPPFVPPSSAMLVDAQPYPSPPGSESAAPYPDPFEGIDPALAALL